MQIPLGKKRLILGITTAAFVGLFSVWLSNQNTDSGKWNGSGKSNGSGKLTWGRNGLYQFAYDEKSTGNLTVKEPHFIELQSDGQWIMYRVPSRHSAIRAGRKIAPLKGTYKIVGDKITFVETKPSIIILDGPGRLSPVHTGRFQGKDFLIVSMTNGIVLSPTVSNARYIKVPYIAFDQQDHSGTQTPRR